VPRDGAIIFGDLIGKLDVLEVACEKCRRKGRYAVARLIEQRAVAALGRAISFLPLALLHEFVDPRDQQTDAVILDAPLAALAAIVAAKDLAQAFCDLLRGWSVSVDAQVDMTLEPLS